MNWIAAYINAVKTNLPRSKREDLSEELRGLLEESLETETGKSFADANEEETLKWLRTREHPTVVASRYHERRELIDQDSFPLFKLTLKYVLIGLAIVYTATAFLHGLSSGNYAFSTGRLLTNILHSGLVAFASITLVFHFFGDKINARSYLEKWDPKDLPDPDQKWEQEPWSSSIAGLVFTGIFLLFINGFLEGVVKTLGHSNLQAVEIQLVAEAASMLPWINTVMIGSILLHGIMIVKPCWSTATLTLSIAISVGTAILVSQLTTVSPFIEFVGESPENADRITKLEDWANNSVGITFYVILIVCLFEIGRSILRMIKLGGRRLY